MATAADHWAEADGGSERSPPAKRPHAPELAKDEDLVAQLAAMQLRAQRAEAQLQAEAPVRQKLEHDLASQKQRAENEHSARLEAEARAPSQMRGGADGLEAVAHIICSEEGTGTAAPEMWTSDKKAAGKMPRLDVRARAAMVKSWLVACVSSLSSGQASCPPEEAAEAKAAELSKRRLADGTASYAESVAFPQTRTASVAFVTNWRPYLHGMVSRAADVGVSAVPTGLRFPSLSSYMAPNRMSYTGTLMGGRILEAFGGLLLNPLCLDLLFLCAPKCLKPPKPRCSGD